MAVDSLTMVEMDGWDMEDVSSDGLRPPRPEERDVILIFRVAGGVIEEAAPCLTPSPRTSLVTAPSEERPDAGGVG